MNEQQQALVNAIPATGRIAYEELERNLRSQGKSLVLQEFHPMRRKKLINAVVDPADNKLYVSRV